MTEWAYINWFPEYGLKLLHPDDAAAFVNGVQGQLGTIFPGETGWIVFRFGDESVRVRPELIHSCRAPAFSYGQLVHAVPPRTPFTGRIRMIQWHFKQKEPFFFVGQKHGHYFAHELQAA